MLYQSFEDRNPLFFQDLLCIYMIDCRNDRMIPVSRRLFQQLYDISEAFRIQYGHFVHNDQPEPGQGVQHCHDRKDHNGSFAAGQGIVSQIDAVSERYRDHNSVLGFKPEPHPRLQGLGGPVKVEITATADKIIDVVATGDKETPGIGTKALEELPAAIISKNSIDVDAVSGATVTSDAIKEAAKKALESAGFDPASYK